MRAKLKGGGGAREEFGGDKQGSERERFRDWRSLGSGGLLWIEKSWILVEGTTGRGRGAGNGWEFETGRGS